MAVDPRQLRTRNTLDQIASGVTGVQLDDVLQSVDTELQMPLRMRATGTHQITVDDLIVKTPIVDDDGAPASSGAGNDRSRTIPPINNALPFSFAGATITIPATNNTNITQSTSGDVLLLSILNDLYYVRIGVNMNSLGQISFTQGVEASTIAGATAPAVPSNMFALGHFIVQRNGGAIEDIDNSSIIQYSGGGGGGSSATTEITLTNNQTVPANVTDFSVDSADYKGFTSNIVINRFHRTALAKSTTINTNLGSGFTGGAVVEIQTQPDDKILVGGSFTNFDGSTRNGLVRLNSNGTEDTSFYTNLGTGFSGGTINVIEIQSDGKILVGGSFGTFNSNTRLRMVRLNSDGTEDTSFYTNLGTGFGNYISAIKVQSDGKIIVGGAFTSLNSNTRNRMVRLNSDGTEDTSFYTNLGTGFGSFVQSATLQSDGKIIVGGLFTSLNSNTRNRMVRLNSDGTEDTSFYTNLGTGFNNSVQLIEVQPNDAIIVSGSFTSLDGNTRNILVRLNSDGTEDTSFYTNLGTGFVSTIFSVSVQTDGKIIVGGAFTSFNGNTRNRILSLNPNGTEDELFYADMGTGFDNYIQTTAIRSDGKILLGGVFTTLDSVSHVRMVAFDQLQYSNFVKQFTLRGFYDESNKEWGIGESDFIGVDPEVELTITTSGQLQYTTSNIGQTLQNSYLRYTLEKL